MKKSRTSGGHGCPYCSGLRVCEANSLKTTHPAVARQWHPTKNGDVTAEDVSSASGKKVWWKGCDKGHASWDATVANRTSQGATGCPYCAGQRVCEANSLKTTHPEVARQWHPTKNGDVTAEDVSSWSENTYWWKG